MTRARMYLRMITKAFVRRLSRVVIASLSIVVGATTLSALGIITYTVPEQIARELRSYGANLVVSPAGTETLRLDDYDFGAVRRLGLLISEVEGHVVHEARLAERPFYDPEGRRLRGS